MIGRNALLLQAVDIGFGEHAALPCHRVQLDSGVALIAKVLGRDLHLGVDLVDDCARAAGALVIHGGNLLLAPGVLVLFEDDDLGVLTAQFDHRIDFGMQLFDRQRDRGNFLNKLGANQIGQRASARTRDKDAAVVRRNADLVLHALEEFQQLLRLLGLVPLIVLPDHLVGIVGDDDRLHRGGAHVHADGVNHLAAGLRRHLARLGEDAGGHGIGRCRLEQIVELNVDFTFAAPATSVSVRM